VIRGYDDANVLVNELTISRRSDAAQRLGVSLGGTWNNLSKVEFYGQPEAEGLYAYMDNIVVNTVPIPPAVFLFGSGLG